MDRHPHQLDHPVSVTEACRLIDQCTADLKAFTRTTTLVREMSVEVFGCQTTREVDIEIFYTPGERRSWDYPGYPASVEVIAVTAMNEKGERGDLMQWMDREAVQHLERELLWELER